MRLVPRRGAGGADTRLSGRPGAVGVGSQGDSSVERLFDCWHARAMTQPPRSRPGPTLAERSDAAGLRTPALRRHCWVRAADGHGQPWPGVLVEWRPEVGAWVGRVVYVVTDEEPPVVVDAWLSAELLSPLAASDSPSD